MPLLSLQPDLTDPASLVNNRQPILRGYDFISKFTTRIKSTQAQVGDLVQWSPQASGTTNMGAGSSVMWNIQLSPTGKFAGNRNMGDPYVALYEGTSATGANQIYPGLGSSVTGTNWTVRSGYDLHATDGTDSYYNIYVRNNGTSASDTLIVARWRYIQNNAGAST